MSSSSGHSLAAVLLCSIYILLQCFFFHHRMENMCHLNSKQFHLPKSQLQPKKQREVIKDCSFHFKCTGLPTLIPAVNRKWFAKKANSYIKHLQETSRMVYISSSYLHGYIYIYGRELFWRGSLKSSNTSLLNFFIWFFTQRTLSIMSPIVYKAVTLSLILTVLNIYKLTLN